MINTKITIRFSGPMASGKTRLIKILRKYLETEGLNVETISNMNEDHIMMLNSGQVLEFCYRKENQS